MDVEGKEADKLKIDGEIKELTGRVPQAHSQPINLLVRSGLSKSISTRRASSHSLTVNHKPDD